MGCFKGGNCQCLGINTHKVFFIIYLAYVRTYVRTYILQYFPLYSEYNQPFFFLSHFKQVWCDMSTCGGGWSLVWKHSYMEVTPLTSDMYYFSDHYRPCTDINSGWCNVPHKSRLNPTEMMIVAYHNKRVV